MKHLFTQHCTCASHAKCVQMDLEACGYVVRRNGSTLEVFQVLP